MSIDHKSIYNSENISQDYAKRDYLDPAEEAIIHEIGRSRLINMDMLDMGVGGGRTTKYFAPLVKKYIGADYAPAMLKASRKKYGQAFDFMECDAREMKCFKENFFDFILFSYNGIDSFSHKDRIDALKEIRRVLRNNGIFYFSSHNLDWMGLEERVSHLKLKNKASDMKSFLDKLRKNGRGNLYDDSLNGKASIYYVTAEEQKRQLTKTGFVNIKTYSKPGIETDNSEQLNQGGWIYYYCEVIKK